MRLIALHSDIFKKYLTEHSHKIYGFLKVFFTHKNPRVRQAAFPAVDAFFTVVANEIVSGEREAKSNKETFKVSFLSFLSD
jgi:hypothetical protein